MKLDTFLKLAVNNHKNARSIIRGVINSEMKDLLLSEPEKEIIEDRLAICTKCPDANINVPTDRLPDTSKGRNDFHCTICGCMLQYKTASFGEQCPVLKWRAWSEEQLKQLNENRK